MYVCMDYVEYDLINVVMVVKFTYLAMLVPLISIFLSPCVQADPATRGASQGESTRGGV